jgi:dihydroxyacetone kinase
MKPDGQFALLINNLGAVPPVEMSLIANAVLASPFADRVALTIGPGPMMTALNMNGFSLSLIRLDAEREQALLSVVAPHAWLPAVVPHAVDILAVPKVARLETAIVASHDAQVERVLAAICDRLIALEPELNRLDAKAGDGDTGSTVATGARSILSQTSNLPLADRVALFAVIGDTLATAMGGSSGVLLSIFFTAAGKASGDGRDLAASLLAGLDRMTFYGGAYPGDRTMVDALSPALRALATGGVRAAADEARKGAEATKAMRKAKAGRSAYIGESDLDGVMDPGAHAVAEVFAAVAGILEPA